MFKGKLLIFSAPSGSGKTTIVKHLLKTFDELSFSVSACTREPRENEIDGVDYYFMRESEFKSHIDAGDFVEWEEVYPGHFYGTLKSEIDRVWSESKHIIFDIDVAGGMSLKKQFPENSLSVFIKPPSYEELEKRLTLRSSESKEKIAMRLQKVRKEMIFESNFDFVLVNDDLKIALEKVEKIVNKFIYT